tara:strand:- start:135 stop:1193 length:1059 start_codon:yes stop_codon:yes gene_type:complete
MKNLLILPNRTVKFSLQKISQTGQKCLVVIDRKKKLLGTLSDGDIRRSILRDKNLNLKISNIFKKNCYYFEKKKIDTEKIKKIFLKHKLDLIPIIDDKKKVIDIILWDNVFTDNYNKQKKTLSLPVVIMAGGKGTRLKPFTDILPKPLIPINEKPFIVHIIENFSEFGLKKFFITINYKSKIIKAFFDEAKYKFKIKFFEEKKPLGTAGSLFYFKKIIKTDFILTNCDIFLKVDLEKIYNFHKINNYDATIVASTKEYTIPYGTCELDNSGKLKKLNEKPKHNYLINTGLYFIKKKFLNLVPNNQFFHLTDLIKLAKSKKYKIGVYPVDDSTWSDVGEWNNFYKTKNTFYNK